MLEYNKVILGGDYATYLNKNSKNKFFTVVLFIYIYMLFTNFFK